MPSIGIPKLDYLGRYRRGETLPLLIPFQGMPDAAPTVRVYQGTTIIATFKLPLVDDEQYLFGTELFLGTDYDDGQYVISVAWEVLTYANYTVMYFDVLGGVGLEPVVSILEQQRPLGRAVISIDDAGLARMAYNPKIRS